MIVHVKNSNKNLAKTVEGDFTTLSSVLEELAKYNNYEDLCPEGCNFTFRRGDRIGETVNSNTNLSLSAVNNEVFIKVNPSKLNAGIY